MIAFVLGNGKSRLKANLDILEGKIYGCNAIYRDFIPKVLVAVDPKMVTELLENNVQKLTQVWTNPHSRYDKNPELNFFKPSLGWSSGPTALHMASQFHETIYILGFDYDGDNNNTLINNVYAGTNNYRPIIDPPTYSNNWKRQTEEVIKKNPNINFIRVVDDKFNQHFNLDKYINYSAISYDKFDEIFKNRKK